MSYDTDSAQVPVRRFRIGFTAVCLFVALALSLAACGKRASSVDLPDGAPEDHYPHTYPDPATDPHP